MCYEIKGPCVLTVLLSVLNKLLSHITTGKFERKATDILNIIMRCRKVEIESVFLKRLHEIFTRDINIVKFNFRVAIKTLAALRLYLDLIKLCFIPTISGLVSSPP